MWASAIEVSAHPCIEAREREGKCVRVYVLGVICFQSSDKSKESRSNTNKQNHQLKPERETEERRETVEKRVVCLWF